LSQKLGRPSAFLAHAREGISRTFVYIDGFNLYYRALRGAAGRKWLDLEAFSAAVLPGSCEIERINYYTAHVSGRLDPGAPVRQHAYLRALGTLPKVRIHFGNFLVTQKWSGLVQPPSFRPAALGPLGFDPEVAYVWKTEEKGSDVNLGVHLVRDAFTRAFDEAAVLTNDTDLVDAIRIVTQEAHLPVTLLSPTAKPATSLVAVSTHIRHVAPYVGPCQLPPVIPIVGKKAITKPPAW
jgi:uncharacterized LabA/DUF88 family protein